MTPNHRDDILKEAEALRRAREEHFRSTPAIEIARRLGAVASKWLDPDYPLRRQTISEVSEASGFPPAMVAMGFDAAFRELLPPKLEELAARELGDVRTLDGFHPSPRDGTLIRAVGPGLITHILAGSIVTPGLWSVCFGLLVKAGNLVKCSSYDRVFPVRFAESLLREDPELGSCVAVNYWGREQDDLTTAALEAVDAVVAFGDDRSIQALSERVNPPRRFVGHGHRVSLAVIGEDVLTLETAEGLSADVAFHDQQGCLSPHVVYVLGERTHCLDFCEEIAQAMASSELRFPRRALAVEEAATIQEARAAHELRCAIDPNARAWASRGSTAWTLLYDENPEFELSCLNRLLRVKRLQTIGQLPDSLAPVPGHVQGIAVAPDELMEPVRELARESGVSYICVPGQLQKPPLTWRGDGLDSLLPLVTLTSSA